MMLYIDNPYTDAWFNLAAEEYLLKNFSDDIFMLWQNETVRSSSASTRTYGTR